MVRTKGQGLVNVGTFPAPPGVLKDLKVTKAVVCSACRSYYYRHFSVSVLDPVCIELLRSLTIRIQSKKRMPKSAPNRGENVFVGDKSDQKDHEKTQRACQLPKDQYVHLYVHILMIRQRGDPNRLVIASKRF